MGDAKLSLLFQTNKNHSEVHPVMIAPVPRRSLPIVL